MVRGARPSRSSGKSESPEERGRYSIFHDSSRVFFNLPGSVEDIGQSGRGMTMVRKIRMEYGSIEIERKMVRLLRLERLCSYFSVASLAAALVILYLTTTIDEFVTQGIQTVLLGHPLLIVFSGAAFAGLLVEGYFRSKVNELTNGNDVRIYEQ